MEFRKKFIFFIFIFFLFSFLFAKNVDLDNWTNDIFNIYSIDFPIKKLKEIHKNFDKNIKNIKNLAYDSKKNLYILATYKKIQSANYYLIEKFLRDDDDILCFFSGIILYKMNLYEKSNMFFEKIKFIENNSLEKFKNFYFSNSYMILKKDKEMVQSLKNLINLESDIDYKSFFILNFLKYEENEKFINFLEENVEKIEDLSLKNKIYVFIVKNSLENREYEKAKYFLSKIDFKILINSSKFNENDYFLCFDKFFEVYKLLEIFGNNKNLKFKFFEGDKKKDKGKLSKFYKKILYLEFKNFKKFFHTENGYIYKIEFLSIYFNKFAQFLEIKGNKEFLKFYNIYKSLFFDIEKIDDENILSKFNEITNNFLELFIKIGKYDELKNLLEKYKNFPDKFQINDLFYKKLIFSQIINENYFKNFYKYLSERKILEAYDLLTKYFLTLKEISFLKANLEIKNNNFNYKFFIFLENKMELEINLFFKGFYLGKIFINKNNFEIHFDKKLTNMINLYNKNLLEYFNKYSEKIKFFNNEINDFIAKDKFSKIQTELIFNKNNNFFSINDINIYFDKNNLLKKIESNKFYLEFFVYQGNFLIKNIKIKDFEIEIDFVKIFEIF